MMKKAIVLVLCFVLLLGIFAGCGAEKDPLAGKFSVGFAKIDVTPEISMPMGGYASSAALNQPSRISEGVYSRVYVTCVALTDEVGTTMLLMTCDSLQIMNAVANELRNNVSEATGVPFENIVLSATHSHSTPTVGGSYVEYYNGVVQAAKDALADRAPATMEYTSTIVENMTFVRHYVTHTGVVMGSNFKPAGAGVPVSHTTEADKEMRLIRYTREGKDPVLMINWQGHATKASGSGVPTHYQISADYVGFFRDYVTENSDCLVAVYIGASGNLNTASRLEDEKDFEDVEEYGAELGKHAVAALENMIPGDTGALQRQTAAVDRLDGTTTEIAAIGGGSLGVVAVPFEMFDTTSMAIRKGSPYDTTLVLGCANGYNQYMPTEVCYTYVGCYEVGISPFPMGTAEKVATYYLDMFNSMHGTTAE